MLVIFAEIISNFVMVYELLIFGYIKIFSNIHYLVFEYFQLNVVRIFDEINF